MLMKVKAINYRKPCAYAPPQEEAVINTDDIVWAVPTEERGSGPFVMIKFRDGTQVTIVGTPSDLLPLEV